MNAIIYTRSDTEYQGFSRTLKAEIPDIEITRALEDGHYHFDTPYDLVIDALDGALGMETALGYRERYSRTMVIWITDDKYFARTAIHSHVFDFHVRPFTEDQFVKSIRSFLGGDHPPWLQMLPRADWACGCEAAEIAGICPVIKHFLTCEEDAQ